MIVSMVTYDAVPVVSSGCFSIGRDALVGKLTIHPSGSFNSTAIPGDEEYEISGLVIFVVLFISFVYLTRFEFTNLHFIIFLVLWFSSLFIGTIIGNKKRS